MARTTTAASHGQQKNDNKPWQNRDNKQWQNRDNKPWLIGWVLQYPAYAMLRVVGYNILYAGAPAYRDC